MTDIARRSVGYQGCMIDAIELLNERDRRYISLTRVLSCVARLTADHLDPTYLEPRIARLEGYVSPRTAVRLRGVYILTGLLDVPDLPLAIHCRHLDGKRALRLASILSPEKRRRGPFPTDCTDLPEK